MKVGGRLCSEVRLSSVFRVWTCSRVSGYPSLIKCFEILMLKAAMTGICQDAVVRICIICYHPRLPHNQSFFRHKMAKLCHINAVLQPSSFSLNTAMKTCQFQPTLRMFALIVLTVHVNSHATSCMGACAK